MDTMTDSERSAGEAETVAYATGFRIRAWSGREQVLDLPYETSQHAFEFGLSALKLVGEGKQLTRMQVYAVTDDTDIKP